MSGDHDRRSWVPDWLPVSVRRLGPSTRLSPQRYRAGLLVAVWSGAVLLALLAAATGALNGLEGQTVDARFRFADLSVRIPASRSWRWMTAARRRSTWRHQFRAYSSRSCSIVYTRR